MKKSLILIMILFLVFPSCSILNRKSEKSLNLKQTIQNVIAGKDSMPELILLRDKELPVPGQPNLISIDTLDAFGKKYYAVIAEYPNPVYNRFALIDSHYNILLMDKSLSGYLKENLFTAGQILFVQVEENFLSRGFIDLKRISLYSLNDKEEAELVFRTFTELNKPGFTYKQDIAAIERTEIQTKIYDTGENNSKLKEDHDVFHFIAETGRYTSDENIFDAFVLSEIQNVTSQGGKPEITSRSSYLKQLGISTSETTEHKLGTFSIPLSSEWNEVKNVKISELLKNTMSGTKFINDHFGAEITVIRIPPDDSSESFIKYPLENVTSGNYRVRFSEKIENGKYFYQFFEYTCGTEKFLLILQTLKTTYDLYKADYQNLINSFSMDC